MQNWKVYIHVFPNGKRYIGITSRQVEKRWKNGNGYYNHKLLYNAIKKYGWENIDHVILFDNLSEVEAKQKEKELIQKYNTFNKEYGYNLTLGGDGTCGHMEANQREKLRFAVRGKNTTLTEKDIFDIKTMLLDGAGRKEIIEKYNMNSYWLSAIISGKNWGYIMPDFVEKYKNIQKEETQRIETLAIKTYQEKQSIKLTANICGIGIDRVRSILVKNNIKIINSVTIKELRSKVIHDYVGGMSKKEIMKKYDISSHVFNNYTAGIYTEKKRIEDQKMRLQMIEMRNNGVKVKDIAKIFNCHREKVTKLTLRTGD